MTDKDKINRASLHFYCFFYDSEVKWSDARRELINKTYEIVRSFQLIVIHLINDTFCKKILLSKRLDAQKPSVFPPKTNAQSTLLRYI